MSTGVAQNVKNDEPAPRLRVAAAGPRALLGLLLAFAGALTAVLAILFLTPSPGAPPVPVWVWVVAVGVGLTAVALLPWRQPMGTALRLRIPQLVAAAALVGACWAVARAYLDRADGFPTAQVWLVAVGLAVAGWALGVAAVDLRAYRRTGVQPAPGWWPTVPLLAPMAVVALLAVGLPLLLPVTSAKTLGDAKPLGGLVATTPVAAPGRIGWQRTFGELAGVAPVLGGAVVARRVGQVEGVDGLTGQTMWRYRREGAAVPVGDLWVTPDGKWVAIGFARGSSSTTRAAVVVLDTETGTEHWWRTWPAGTELVAMTDDAVVFAVGGAGAVRRLVGYDVQSGERRWSWTSKATERGDCVVPVAGVFGTPDRVFVVSVCGDLVNPITLDENGEVDGYAIYALASQEKLSGPTIGAVSVRAAGPDRVLVAMASTGPIDPTWLFDVREGRELANLSIDPPRIRSIGGRAAWWQEGVATAGDQPRYLVGDPLRAQARRPVTGLAGLDCQVDTVGWTARRALVLCRQGEGPYGLVAVDDNGSTAARVELPARVTNRPTADGGLRFVGGGPLGVRDLGAPMLVHPVTGDLIGLR